MATGTEPSGAHRAYRAACPNCGAPVEFASAASASAVCSFCRSTLVRDGEALRRIGVSAELFDDHSPLQLGVAGRLDGAAFTLIGRLQLGYAEGSWNEWHAFFDDGRSAWLSEDNGAYVMAFEAPPPGDAPRPERLRVGERHRIGGRDWSVASVVQVRLIAAQGELPTPPRLEGEFLVADLRNEQGEVATIDGTDPVAIHWSIGRAVLLAELSLQGLRDVAEKTLGSRGVACPNCGQALEPKLANTQALSCPQCRTVVDISQGVGGELAHYAQNNTAPGGLEPQIPLGKVGRLALGGAPLPWQVVGYLERCDLPAPGDDEEEQTFWREYLLYEPKSGFAFLVDAEDGWSWVRPITGAPNVKGEVATWRGVPHRLKYSYDAKVTWVQGEFYWRVQREERARVSDYQGEGKHASKRLSREETRREGAQEVTWSAGDALPAAKVAEAFELTPDQREALARDVAPVSSGKKGWSWGTILLIVAVILVIEVLSNCSFDDCQDQRAAFGEQSAEYRQCIASRGSSSTRTSGGSSGGYSSGGGHK